MYLILRRSIGSSGKRLKSLKYMVKGSIFDYVYEKNLFESGEPSYMTQTSWWRLVTVKQR